MTDTLPLVWGFMREIPYCESWRNAGCNLSVSSIALSKITWMSLAVCLGRTAVMEGLDCSFDSHLSGV